MHRVTLQEAHSQQSLITVLLPGCHYFQCPSVLQFERLQFAYQKATRDAAYARTVEMLLERERAKKAAAAAASAAADAEPDHAVPN